MHAVAAASAAVRHVPALRRSVSKRLLPTDRVVRNAGWWNESIILGGAKSAANCYLPANLEGNIAPLCLLLVKAYRFSPLCWGYVVEGTDLPGSQQKVPTCRLPSTTIPS
eukprot:4211956-Amphidinium_carterae.2